MFAAERRYGASSANAQIQHRRRVQARAILRVLLSESIYRMNRFIGDTSYLDPDVTEVPSLWASTSLSSRQKRKRSQVVPREVIVIDEDDDTDEVVIIGGNLPDKKNKQPMKYENGSKIQVKDGNSLIKPKAEKDVPSSKLNGFVFDQLDFKFEDYDYAESEDDYDEDKDDYDDEYDYDMAAFVNDKNNLNLAAQFDKLDLPPGVEATVPWLRNDVSKTPIVKQTLITDNEIDVKYKAFKQFDSVRDSADHYFHRPELLKITPAGKKTGKDWAKRIQQEWKVLEKDLPEAIYVRIYEDRMDLFRAVIIGPAGTPYHDGLFFFDIFFPPTYPLVPPLVHYHSGGLRLNPNLYACGKVCLSLLNTWSGHGCERWNPKDSTMLQVLVSIQALVLNAKPYFNEPGYGNSANTPYGEAKSLSYNEEVFILSCKTMLYSLRKPPKHFEDFVAGHFQKNGRKILVACRTYIQGAQVGCVLDDMVEDVDVRVKSSSSAFKTNLRSVFELLEMEFTVKGADCQFHVAQNVKNGSTAASGKDASAGWLHI